MEYLGMIKRVGEEIANQIVNAVKAYVRFIWQTPNHLGRWAAVFIAAPILFLGLPYLPGISDDTAWQLAEVAIVGLAFFALAATLFGGRGG